MRKPYLEAGEFVTTHGVIGEIKLYPWSDNPMFLSAFEKIYLYPDGRKPYKIAGVREHKGMSIVKLDGVGTVEEARLFVGKTVYVDRKEAKLPKGCYFVQDLLGARVEDAETGRVYGKIKSITRPGRHDVYEIEDGLGKSWWFPAVEPFVVSIDIDEGLVKIKTIEGMFDDTN